MAGQDLGIRQKQHGEGRNLLYKEIIQLLYTPSSLGFALDLESRML